MSAEQVVLGIIDNAAAVAEAKSQQASDMASRAMTAANGVSFVTPKNSTFKMDPKEPEVHIPRNAAGLDKALYDSAYGDILRDLTGNFSKFFDEHFPDIEAVEHAAQWLSDVFTEGGTGLKPHIEAQIWERERARALTSAKQAGEQVLATFASRGFPLPPGAAQHQISLANQHAAEQASVASREVAIKQAEMELENIRFAVVNAINYRIEGIRAASEYIKTLALGPQIATELATTAANAQSNLINAASSYYNARIRVEESKWAVESHGIDTLLDAGKANMAGFNARIQNQTQALVSLATSLGSQAASALNAVNANAALQVHGSA